MIKELRFPILIILTSFLTSYAVIKDNNKTDLDKVDNTNYSKLNGVYQDCAKVTEGHIYKDFFTTVLDKQSFWKIIHGYHPHYWYCKGNQDIKLEFKSSKRAVVSLFKGDSLVEKKIIRGNIKDGYFYRRPYFIAIPLIPFLFGYNTYRYKIGLNKDSSLIVDFKWNELIYAAVAGNRAKGESSSVFLRK